MAVKEIVKDPNFLAQKSGPFNPNHDYHIIQDLLDTANAQKKNCVGLAAPQIGYLKRVILVKQDKQYIPLINPVIIKHSPNWYYTMEGCLSLDGQRNVKRYSSIMVSYTTTNGKKHTKQFDGFVAEIIQHEVDHLNGVLI
jgi:peptide deformylase